MNSSRFPDNSSARLLGAGANLSEEIVRTPSSNQFHDNWSPHLTHRMRVLLHTKPLLFDLRFGDPRCDSTLRHYDSLALTLKVFDLIIETTGMEQEVDSDTAMRALTPLMIGMDQAEGIEPDAVSGWLQLIIR